MSFVGMAEQQQYGPHLNFSITQLNQTIPISYDHQGALTYVIAVCCVYALAIFFMIASHVRRRQDKREVDQEINNFLRSQPAIRAAEERQRRRNLKRAMKPFIDLMINKRTIGVQADMDLHGNAYGSQTFIAMYGAPGGTPAFSEEVESADIIVTGSAPHRRRHSTTNPFRKQTQYELNPSLLLRENDKSLQCNLKPNTPSSPTQSRLTVPSSGPPPGYVSTSRKSSNPSYGVGLADAEFMCDLTAPIMFHFDSDSRRAHNAGQTSKNHFQLPRSITPGADNIYNDSGVMKSPSNNIVIHIDREEELWTHSPRPHRKFDYSKYLMEEKISSV